MRRPGSGAERLIGLFLIGVVGFTPPVLLLFSVPRLVAGVPLLFLYLFGLWMALVALAAIAVRALPDDADSKADSGGDGPIDNGAASMGSR